MHHQQWHGLLRKIEAKSVTLELWKEGRRIADFRFMTSPVKQAVKPDRLQALIGATGDDLVEQQLAIAELNIPFEKSKPYAYEDQKGILTDKLSPTDFQLKAMNLAFTLEDMAEQEEMFYRKRSEGLEFT